MKLNSIIVNTARAVVIWQMSGCAVQIKFNKRSTVSECSDFSSTTGDEQLGIVGGTFAGSSTEPEKATAGPLIVHDLPGNKYKAGTCTGVVATENALITAAHCVEPEEGSFRTRVFVSFASTLPDNIAAHTHQAARVVIHPSYGQTGTFSNFDLAVVILSSPIPAGQVIPSFVTTTDELSTGRTVTAIGYGVTGSLKKDSGTKRVAQTKIVDVIDEVSYPDSPLFFQVRVADTEGLISGACFGDSGGPGFLENSAHVFGVVQGSNSTVNDNATSCESGDYNYTLIAPYIDWIEESLQVSLNKTATPIVIAQKPTVSQTSNTQSTTESGTTTSSDTNCFTQ